jgi:1-acyl-sn-glycerol-3-phosphate acyltransferase
MLPFVALGMRTLGRSIVAARIDLRVEGLENVPRRGAALIIARHFHHLYDGAALVAAIPRPVHVLVALDWVRGQTSRAAMEALCRLAEWPVVLREDALEDALKEGRVHAYRPAERRRYLVRALEKAKRLLRAEKLLAIFPEGYPAVDPVSRRKDASGWLPFRAGFATILEGAARAGTSVSLIPAGFTYEGSGAERPHVVLRFGPAVVVEPEFSRTRIVELVECAVRALSR